MNILAEHIPNLENSNNLRSRELEFTKRFGHYLNKRVKKDPSFNNTIIQVEPSFEIHNGKKYLVNNVIIKSDIFDYERSDEIVAKMAHKYIFSVYPSIHKVIMLVSNRYQCDIIFLENSVVYDIQKVEGGITLDCVKVRRIFGRSVPIGFPDKVVFLKGS
jgi:hypothetical protein